MKRWQLILLILAGGLVGWLFGVQHGIAVEAGCNTRIVLEAEREAWEGGQH